MRTAQAFTGGAEYQDLPSGAVAEPWLRAIDWAPQHMRRNLLKQLHLNARVVVRQCLFTTLYSSVVFMHRDVFRAIFVITGKLILNAALLS